MILLFQHIFTAISEIPSPQFNNINILDHPTNILENIEKTSDSYILRSTQTTGPSIITFKETNPYDEWSFVFKFTPPTTIFPEKSSIHFWYTNAHLENGDFYGNSGEFVGLMAGMEWQGNYTSVLLSSNSDSKTYNQDDSEHILKEELPKMLFKNVLEYTMKIIFTKNNFKIELYNNEELIYDHLRFYDTAKLGHINNNMHISITTNYDNMPIDKHFKLKSVQLFERKELQDYDKYASHSTVEIDTEDHELQHAISALEFFMNYVLLTFGTKPEGTTILRGIDNSIKEVARGIQKLESVKHRLASAKKDVVLGSLPSKLTSLDVQVASLIRDVHKLEYILKEFEKNHFKGIKNVWYVMIAVIVVIFAVLMLKDSNKPKKE